MRNCKDVEYDPVGLKLACICALNSELLSVSYSLGFDQEHIGRNTFLGVIPVFLFTVGYRCLLTDEQREEISGVDARMVWRVMGGTFSLSGLLWFGVQSMWPPQNASAQLQLIMMAAELACFIVGLGCGIVAESFLLCASTQSETNIQSTNRYSLFSEQQQRDALLVVSERVLSSSIDKSLASTL